MREEWVQGRRVTNRFPNRPYRAEIDARYILQAEHAAQERRDDDEYSAAKPEAAEDLCSDRELDGPEEGHRDVQD